MAFRENRSFGTTYYLYINSDGNLYEKSNEPKEGFVQHINPNSGQPAGYWKEYYNGVVGYINYIGLKSSTFSNGNTVTNFLIVLKDYELNENYCISIPLVNQKGNIKGFVKSFVKYYENIDFSREIYFNVFKKKKDDEFGSSELIIAYAGVDGEKDQLVERFYKKGVNGWPDPVEVTGFDGKKSLDYSAQNNFTYQKITEYSNRFNASIKDIRAGIMAKLGLGSNTQQEPTAPQAYTQQAAAPQQVQQPQSVPSAIPYQNYQQPAQQPAQYQAPAYTPQPTAQPAAPAPAPATRSTKPQYQTQPQPQAQMPNFPPMEEDDLPF